ncbi:MAG: response regulator [Syntrophobacteraceae bacterium]|jgi:CheY-like chemotaxis protein
MWETGRKVSIVMVDDDEDDCFIIKEALDESELDHSLTTMESGSELLDYLHGRGKYAGSKPEYPDLILLDLYLPGLSGSDILRYIRKNPQFGHLDVVVLTDSTDWSELSECYRLGATAVFSKGKWLETFAEIIRISGSYWFKFVTVQLDKTRPDSKSRHGV